MNAGQWRGVGLRVAYLALLGADRGIIGARCPAGPRCPIGVAVSISAVVERSRT
jgi:hypothetical protein